MRIEMMNNTLLIEMEKKERKNEEKNGRILREFMYLCGFRKETINWKIYMHLFYYYTA